MTSFKNKILILALSIFMSSTGLTGIRIIDNGGGYAEMLALSSVDTIQRLIILSTELKKDLRLSTKEQALLDKIVALKRIETSNIVISFSEHLEKINISQTGDELKIAIPYKILYTKNAQAKPLSEISYLVFISIYYEFQISDYKTLKSLGYKTFGSLHSKSESHYIDAENAIVVKSVSIDKSDVKSLIYLSKDQERDTLYINPFIEKKLPCAAGSPSLISLKIDKILNRSITATIQFQCNGKDFSAHYLLPYESSEGLRLYYEAAVVSRLSELPSDCLKWLKD